MDTGTGIATRPREELQEKYLEMLSSGITSSLACKELGIDNRVPGKWASVDGTFAEQRNLARAAAAEALESELLTAPKQYEPGRARVITENIRWLLSKWQPATYGDKLELNVNQTVDISQAIEQGRARQSRLPGSDQAVTIDAQPIDSEGKEGEWTTDTQSDTTYDPEFLDLL